MTAGGPPAPPSQDVQEAVLAHYLSRPDVIRLRAQHSAAIAGAAAAVLIAAGGVAELYRYPLLIELLLALAIIGWLCAVGAYMHVVAFHVDPVTPFDDGNVRADAELLQEFENNADDVRRRLAGARYVGLAALVLTVVAFGAAAGYAEHADNKVLSRVVVSDDLGEALGAICGSESEVTTKGRRDFRAELRLNDLALSFVDLHVNDAACKRGKIVEVRVPSDGILSAARVK
jgi:hypothetical protein